mmetsp:Transcript_7435/g.11961  ORF Transcript_7435/g.11961 Transcript_7435/m.11961 type:complete len:101 (-) Transcript_7435:732-1034(-)
MYQILVKRMLDLLRRGILFFTLPTALKVLGLENRQASPDMSCNFSLINASLETSLTEKLSSHSLEQKPFAPQNRMLQFSQFLKVQTLVVVPNPILRKLAN